MSGKKEQLTSEEYILRLRQGAQAFTGIDPGLGRVKKPARQLSDEEIIELFESKNKGSKVKDADQ